MGRAVSPTLSRLVAAKFKWITFSFFVGFGLAACAGDESAEEPVATEQGAPASEDGEMSAEASGEEAQAPEAMPDEEALEEDLATAPAEDSSDPTETAPPPEVMDQASDSVDAELASEDTDTSADALEASPSAPVEVMADEPAGDDTAGMFQAPAATEPVESPSMQTIPFGTVSSPGAAANLPNVASSSQAASTSVASQDYSGSDQATYVVQSGDTLARIASRIYGNFSNWQAIASANGLNAPYVIFPGDELRFPLTNAKAKTFADKAQQSRKTITVRQGDTLSTLAEQVFGSAYSWKVFLSYNKDKISNPHRIAAGMKLAYVDLGGGHAQAHATPKAKKKATIVSKPKVEPVVQTAAPAKVEPTPAAEEVEEAPAAEEAAEVEEGPVAPEALEESAVDSEESPAEQDSNLGE